MTVRFRNNNMASPSTPVPTFKLFTERIIVFISASGLGDNSENLKSSIAGQIVWWESDEDEKFLYRPCVLASDDTRKYEMIFFERGFLQRVISFIINSTCIPLY